MDALTPIGYTLSENERKPHLDNPFFFFLPTAPKVRAERITLARYYFHGSIKKGTISLMSFLHINEAFVIIETISFADLPLLRLSLRPVPAQGKVAQILRPMPARVDCAR